MVHYVESIRKFGSPNGLCSSITESRHITAVKETWRRSSRHEPIDRMVRCLTRLSKIAAARVEFGHRGMLYSDVLTAARLELGDEDANDVELFGIVLCSLNGVTPRWWIGDEALLFGLALVPP